MIQIIGARPYEEVRDLCHEIKKITSARETIECADYIASKMHKADTVLIPIPSHSGKPTHSKRLAEAIQYSFMKIGKGYCYVIDILRSEPHESLCKAKQTDKNIDDITLKINSELTPEQIKQQLSTNVHYYLVDNVVDTGKTARACLDALPFVDGIITVGNTGRWLPNNNEHLKPLANFYERYELYTWPESQEFVGRPGCVLVNPPETMIDTTALDSSYFVPERITGNIRPGCAYIRIPYPDSQYWKDMMHILKEEKTNCILTDYDTQDAYVLEGFYFSNEPGPIIKPQTKEKKDYEITLYFHTNVTMKVKAENAQDAKEAARCEVSKDEYVQQLLDGLQEDDTPDVIPVDNN